MCHASLISSLIKDLLRDPVKIIPGDKTVVPASEFSQDAVMEALMAMTVGIDNFLYIVSFRYLGKDAAFFKDVGRRIMQKHNELAEAVCFSHFKGFDQTP